MVDESKIIAYEVYFSFLRKSYTNSEIYTYALQNLGIDNKKRQNRTLLDLE